MAVPKVNMVLKSADVGGVRAGCISYQPGSALVEAPTGYIVSVDFGDSMSFQSEHIDVLLAVFDAARAGVLEAHQRWAVEQGEGREGAS